MTRIASTTTTLTTSVTMPPASPASTIISGRVNVALPPVSPEAASATSADIQPETGTVPATRRSVILGQPRPTAQANAVAHGAPGGHGTHLGHRTAQSHTMAQPASYGWDFHEIGENRYALPFFRTQIHAPGTLARKDRRRAHTYLATLEQRLAGFGPGLSNEMLRSAWGPDRTRWLKQVIRLMQEVEPAHCPPGLPGRLAALGLPSAAARAFFTFTTTAGQQDRRHHAIALFAGMDHPTRAQLLEAAHLPAAQSREVADAFATRMLGDMHTPLATAALLMVLALRPSPGHLAVLVDERFAAPLLDGLISSSSRYDEARAFMEDALHSKRRHVTVELINMRSANPARHVELLADYLARHGRMPAGFPDLLGHYVRDIAGDMELPDDATVRDIARGTARRLPGPEATSAVARVMGRTSTERLRVLLGHGVAVDIPDTRGFTALHYAIAACDVDKVRLLLQHFADPLRRAPGPLQQFSNSLRQLGGTLCGLPPHKPLKFAQKRLARLHAPAQRERMNAIIGMLRARAAQTRTLDHTALAAQHVALATPTPGFVHPLLETGSTAGIPSSTLSVSAPPHPSTQPSWSPPEPIPGGAATPAGPGSDPAGAPGH